MTALSRFPPGTLAWLDDVGSMGNGVALVYESDGDERRNVLCRGELLLVHVSWLFRSRAGVDLT